MHIAYTAEQESLRKELQAYYQKLLTPEVREAIHQGHGTGEAMRATVRQMGSDGWLGIGWPEKHGGQGRGPEVAWHSNNDKLSAVTISRLARSRRNPSRPAQAG